MLGKGASSKVTLSLGTGIRPMLYIYAFQALYLLGGMLAACGKIQERRAIPSLDPKKYETAATLILVACLVYTAVRYFYIPDYPIFAWLASGGSGFDLRDIAFEYGSNTDVPYIFLPSINGNFIRIGMPIATFMLLTVARTHHNRRALWLGRLGYVMSLILIVGTFKRTPLLYFVLWNTLYYQLFAGLKSVGRLIVACLLIFACLTTITAFYGDDISDWQVIVKNLLWRGLIGEAIGEFVAVEHFGTTYDYLGNDIPLSYFQKVMGYDVMTFSEWWKIESGGSRGYTSIGIMAEIAISVGPIWSMIPFLMWGWLIALLDRITMSMDTGDRRPFLAGLVVVIAFISVKGFFSQLFAGGALFLLLLSILVVWNTRQRRTTRMVWSQNGPLAAGANAR
jgi:hypothetical protein